MASALRKKDRPTRPEVDEVARALSAPFALEEVRFKPAVVTGNRALALAYVDARAIQDRLDEVLGVLGWQDSYRCLEDGSVVCRLRLRVGQEWVTKMDVGSPSEQPDGGDRRKAAFSDALKRAAVKFGIGRYLYRLPQQWVDYDPRKKQFARPPQLPPFALPALREAGQGDREKGRQGDNAVTPAAVPPSRKTADKGTHGLPANGTELRRRLHDYDAKLAAQGVCAPGELVKHVMSAGVKAGFGADLVSWSGPAMLLAAEETRAFENRVRADKVSRADVA